MNGSSFPRQVLGLSLAVGLLIGCRFSDDVGDDYTYAASARKSGSTTSTGSRRNASGGSAQSLASHATGGGISGGDKASASAFGDKANWDLATMAFPTGDAETSALMLRKATPREVRRDQEFTYYFEVTNLTNLALDNVVVTDHVPSGFNVTAASSKFAKSADGALVWDLGSIESRGKNVIRVTGQIKEVGMAATCSEVSYNTGVCSTFNVVEPALQLAVHTPEEASICDEIPFYCDVTNAGTGTARDIVVEAKLPAHLVTLAGAETVSLPVGSLTAGETKTVSTKLKALRRGKYQALATARGGDGLSVEATSPALEVLQPALSISGKAPERQFLGRPLTYEFEVKNTGDGIASNTVVESLIPDGAEIVRASIQPQRIGSNLVWNMGDLQPEQTKTVAVTYSATQAGSFRSVASAKGDCVDSVDSNALSTRLTGIPAILLEVVDASDPILVGENVTYVIRVTNQGTAPGTQIEIACDLEESMRYVSGTGPTRASINGATVTFGALPSLAPKAEATWKLVVRSTAEADARFTVRMNTGETQRPVQETEATNFYK